MESVEASLVSLGSQGQWPYALVPRPLPQFIPSECAVTGEIRVFDRVADDAKIEANYFWETKIMGWMIVEGGEQ